MMLRVRLAQSALLIACFSLLTSCFLQLVEDNKKPKADKTTETSVEKASGETPKKKTHGQAEGEGSSPGTSNGKAAEPAVAKSTNEIVDLSKVSDGVKRKAARALVGVWIGKCLPDKEEGFFNQSTLTFADEIFSREWRRYKTGDCVGEFDAFVFITHYATDGSAIDYSADGTLKVVGFDPDFISDINGSTLCGEGFLKSGVTKEIKPTDCRGVYAFTKDARYSILTLEKGELRLGRSSEGHDGRTPATREQEIDREDEVDLFHRTPS